MRKTSFRLFLLSVLAALAANSAFAQGAIAKKAQLVNEAKDTCRVMFETVDQNGDKKIEVAEFQDAYASALVDSPRVAKQVKNVAVPTNEVAEQIFNLIDTDGNQSISKKEAESALMAKVLVFKYRYIPTADEKGILDAANKQALKTADLKAELDEAAALREKAKIEWGDASLQKKAKDATLKSVKALHQEMIRIDPRAKPILERMAETEP
jgi:hypothetical protein